jgi:enamine deaminase RidA (YjgF/YER057c/UK114 family)
VTHAATNSIQVIAEYFTENPPGRTTVEVAKLPAGAHVESTVTALAGQGPHEARDRVPEA